MGNVFDAEVASVAAEAAKSGDTALTATKAASEALVKLARKNAEDPNFESPFSLEWKAFGGFWKRGGKMDDITVVVGMVVETESAADLQEAVAESEQLGKSMEALRDQARSAEARTAAVLEQRMLVQERMSEIQAVEDMFTANAVKAGQLPPETIMRMR